MVALGERTTPNGQELLAEFIQYGHQKPFEEIVRRYAGMVFNVCYRITKDKHEAEDATQAVFLTLALQARRGADIKALGPWLQQVAKRLSLDTRRSKKRRATREERHHVEQTIRRESLMDDTLPSADLDELKTILHEELQKLPAKYRMPLILHYFGGLSREEMAAELNCKPSTLGVRIFRGREMLAGRLTSRGINISLGTLAAVLGYVVKHAVSETLIRSTSHAATAVMAGYDGAGFASSHVIGLTRRATGALAIGKVRVAAITFMLAGTSLGAGAKALGILPKIDVQQIITNQLMRMVSPLMNPFGRSLRVDSQTESAKITVAVAPVATPAAEFESIDIANSIANPPVKTTTKTESVAQSNAGNVIKSASTPSKSVWSDPLAMSSRSVDSASTVAHAGSAPSSSESAKTTEDADVIASSESSGGGSGGTGGSGAGEYHSSPPLPSKASSGFTMPSSGMVFSSNNLYIGTPSASSSGHVGSSEIASSGSSASPASLIQIPSIGGTVTESSNGELRGWGIINRTGTLEVSGQVVADGQGVDRTLNLSSFTAVQSPASNPVTNTATSINTAPATTASAGAATTTGATSSVVSSTASNAPAPTTPATTSIAPSPAAKYVPSVGAVAASSIPAVTQVPAASQMPTESMTPPTPMGNPSSSVSSVTCGDGWYAINHGRLALPLIPSSTDPSTLTWGGDPNTTSLSLVNSVRITLHSDSTDTAPTAIDLLSTDRSDVPDLMQITGTAIGMWQVDTQGSDIAAAELTVCYNAVLADELGASPSSVQLWTYSDDTDQWQTVSPSSYELDTTDHSVSGYATDIDYFAVSVDPTIDENVEQLLADHLDEFSGEKNAGSGAVPEPVGLPLLLAGGVALLGRRGRRTSESICPQG